MIEKIMKETTDNEKIELFNKLARYFVANADGDINDIIELREDIGNVLCDITKVNIGTHKKSDCWM